MSYSRQRKFILPGARWAQFEGFLHGMFSIFKGFRRQANTKMRKENEIKSIRDSAGELKSVPGFCRISVIGSGSAVGFPKRD